MLIIIYKKQGFKQNPLPVNIGKSNAAFSIILLVRGFTANSGKTMSLPSECVLVSLVLASSFSQLLANIALAIDRYLATSFPLMYRQYTSWKLWKKPLLIGETICLMVAGMLGPISVVYEKNDFVTKAIVISRLTAILLMVFFYYKVYMKYKSSRVAVSANDNPGNPTDAERARSRNDKHFLMMCIGITGRFVLLNLPISIYSTFGKMGITCDTFQGKLLTSFTFFTRVNVAVDPLWYFYIEKRKRSNRS